MFILLRKRDLLFSACFFVFLAAFSALMLHGISAPVSVFAPQGGVPVTVVIDPGHGGEDGGAVSPTGVQESHINLAVSLRLDELLRFAGQRTVLTRREDVSTNDEGLSTVKARKASDLRNRVKLVNDTENAVLWSIHQNSLPSSTVTHGAQVFWNTQQGAEELAGAIQDTLNLWINAGNEKHTKPIPQTIYLMKNAEAPAVLVECGFLSNSAETAQLQEPSYQMKIAAAVAVGYLRCLKGESQ